MESVNWKTKAMLPIEKEIADLDRQIGELTQRKTAFEKALSLFKGVANSAPNTGRPRGKRKKQADATAPAQNQSAA